MVLRLRSSLRLAGRVDLWLALMAEAFICRGDCFFSARGAEASFLMALPSMTDLMKVVGDLKPWMEERRTKLDACACMNRN